MRALLLAVVLLAAGLFCCVTAQCSESYSADVVGKMMGVASSTNWTYDVYNTSSDQNFTLWMVAVEVDDDTDILNAVGPLGWVADFTSQPHFVSWMCFGQEIPAGLSQSGFELTLSSTPVYQTYTVMFNNSETGECLVTDGNVSVPEPGSAVALLTGLSSFIAFVSKRRRSV